VKGKDLLESHRHLVVEVGLEPTRGHPSICLLQWETYLSNMSQLREDETRSLHQTGSVLLTPVPPALASLPKSRIWGVP
jgi:hypothetical protein